MVDQGAGGSESPAGDPAEPEDVNALLAVRRAKLDQLRAELEGLG